MGYKEENLRAYDSYAGKFEQIYEVWFKKHLTGEADRFTGELNGSKVLDLGSGPGNHAVYLTKKGLNVTCVDISPEMVKRCRRKGLKAKVMDIERLAFPQKSFDGVWASAVLLHIPKTKLPSVIKSVHRILKPNGLFYLRTKEGSGEGYEENDKYPGTKRWFTHLTEEEIDNLVAPYFRLVNKKLSIIDRAPNFWSYLLRKNDDLLR